MKRIPWMLAFIAFTMTALHLQAEEPQIAFRLLDNYVQEKQQALDSSSPAGAVFSIVSGALLLGGGIGLYAYGDQAADAMGAQRLDSGLKLGLSLGLGVTGGILLVTGIQGASRKSRDLRMDHQDVYAEPNPLVQEAMAAATLKALSDRGRNARVGTAVVNISIAALTTGLSIGANLSDGLPWSKDLDKTLGAQVWTLGGAVGSIFSLSEEERLYSKYLAAREAYYASAPASTGPGGDPYYRPEGEGPLAPRDYRERAEQLVGEE